MLLKMMSAEELKECITDLKRKHSDCIFMHGFYHERTAEISKRLQVYIDFYNEQYGKGSQ
ncbi:hypothetical protein AC622_14580 [Bacillus sp. FJAT-27916]|uniref:hypothetical protein n=1 Tax=Bacillaceae TaxID=186817 RepID=UPI000670BE89|nr:hypothetical protein [Bacillus sp. FJAT-27916]KMY45296.1 hypothetical protein AC622_14580 [Bacillus sp. FJAT-27916]